MMTFNEWWNLKKETLIWSKTIVEEAFNAGKDSCQNLTKALENISVSTWLDVNDSLPETEPNTDGLACAVLTAKGNVYRARYMHDVHEDGESKYWSGFDIDYKGVESEWYEIGEKVTHWIYLPIQGGAE